MSRRMVRVEGGALRIEQRIRTSRGEIGTDASGPACTYAHVRVARGSVAYLHGDVRVPAPMCFAVFLPPFSVVQAVLARCDVTSIAFAFEPAANDIFPIAPTLVAADPRDRPTSREDVLRRLREINGGVPVRRDRDPAPIARQAKSVLDAEYATSLTVSRVAKRVRASPAFLSQMFKKAYGMPPVQYRHQVRIIDALMRFASGSAPAAVFQDVGFDDLSRFYKIFRKVACAPPGSYRPRRLRNAKT